MRSEKEIKREIDELQKLEIEYKNTILGDMAGISKRRLLWVLED